MQRKELTWTHIVIWDLKAKDFIFINKLVFYRYAHTQNEDEETNRKAKRIIPCKWLTEDFNRNRSACLKKRTTK